MRLRQKTPSVYSAFFLLFASFSAGAQTSLEDIQQVELANLAAGQQAQQRIDDLDEQRRNLSNDYRVVLKQNTNLEKYNDQLVQTVHSQDDDIASLKEQIQRINHLERDIVPMMSDMLKALDNFIQLDTPFLLEERNKRIEKLKVLLANGSISNSEKYRRVLEAYQIENDYGRTIEAYEGTVNSATNTETQDVTFFKVGRVAYLYQTLDKSQTFHWSKADKSWHLLDKHYNDKINEGIKMAKEQIPSNLMFIPLEAPALPLNPKNS